MDSAEREKQRKRIEVYDALTKKILLASRHIDEYSKAKHEKRGDIVKLEIGSTEAFILTEHLAYVNDYELTDFLIKKAANYRQDLIDKRAKL